MAGPLDQYPTRAGVFDETVAGDGAVREAYRQMVEQFEALGLEDVRSRAEYVSTSYHDQGVTFDYAGEERPFPLDIVPRVIDAPTWAHVEAGVAQRVRALEEFLADVYGAMQIVTDRVLPRHVVTTSAHYHRVAFGIQPVNGVRIHVSGIDLVRDGDGVFRVLEDNVRIPSGVSYVLTNRRAMTATLPEVVGTHRIRPVAAYPARLLRALRAAAPSGVQDPEVVVLTPGPFNSAYFEHSLLARLMGCRLVEGRDLVTQGGRVMMRDTHGMQPVHVIYRRVDDDFLDPVAFRNDSVLGCPGVLSAARAGNVTIANAVGNGVADDKLMYSYVPDLIRYYLDEEPLLPNVDTWRLEDPSHREEVLDRLDELVLKPVDGSGGKGIVIGPQADRAELDALRERVIAAPRGWVAQPVVQLSTVPTMVEEGMRPRHVDLRPFAINDGEKVWVLPGGLTRVALGEGELIVNSSRGGGSKDTWVLSGDGRRTRVLPRPQVAFQTASAPQVAQKRSEAEPSEQEQQQQQVRLPRAGGAPC
ncbi:circularly permuted type 2 ATP-grasp protein [Ornithinimicrobium cerasi]|uniref:circularly permuted type 2 ATP-grasp protein n=1 Tax=Ornithinimicrobium cerasi TaxID=2248773 RepID=UPI000EFF124D|nr:circularly permuted type 2 ATP-grasp protein [Ornithinimicrobium cerasi]